MSDASPYRSETQMFAIQVTEFPSNQVKDPSVFEIPSPLLVSGSIRWTARHVLRQIVR